MRINHVAFLVPSVAHAASVLRERGFVVGPIEEFAAEQTREAYVGADALGSRLLLMEPTGAGSYLRALETRGPGFHHLGIDVLSLDECLFGLRASGLHLHLNSLETMKRTRTAWLVRPGFPMRIEVQERPVFESPPPFVSCVHLPLTDEDRDRLVRIGLSDFFIAGSEGAWVSGGETIRIADLLS